MQSLMFTSDEQEVIY